MYIRRNSGSHLRSDPLRSELGATAIEFAIILPTLIGLLGSIVDYSALFFAASIMQAAAYVGVRKAVTIQGLDVSVPTTAHSVLIRGIVQTQIPTRNPASYTVTISGPSNLPNDQTDELMVTVSVEETFHFYFLPIFGMSSLPLKRESVMRYEW